MSSNTGSSREGTCRGERSRRAARATRRRRGTFAQPTAPPTPDQWEAWTSWLARRREPRAGVELWTSTGKRSPLLWAMPGCLVPETTSGLVGLLQSVSRHRAPANGRLAALLERWLEHAETAPPTAAHAIECLAWCHAMPALAGLLPAAPWSQLLSQLLAIAAESAALSLEQQPLVAPLLNGELPLTLAYLFPEIHRCHRLWNAAGRRLSATVSEHVDGAGLPRGDQLPVSRPVLACWTRCRELGRAADRTVLDAQARDRYSACVRQLLCLTRADGTGVFSDAADDRWPDSLLRAALEFSDEPACRAIAAATLAPHARRPAEAHRDLPACSAQSEWAETAALRRGWSRRAAQFVIAYANRSVRCELNADRQTLWSGNWELAVALDQQALRPTSNWEQVCWVSDEDGDYLELQMRLEGDHVVQRLVYLARADNFLLLADAFLGRRCGEIAYRSSLPLASGISFVSETATWEGVLRGKRRAARIMPLALPEWRAGGNVGGLHQAEQCLRWQQQHTGQRLFVPLFLDLEPRRFARPVTWRQLTVAERLTIQDANAAVGFRVQVAGQHWLIYRSLGPRGNRTVLGQNFSSEFALARVHRDGSARKLVEIE